MSTKRTLVIVIIALVVIAVVWYFSYMLMNLYRFGSDSQQTTNNTSNAPDTTLNISGELQQIPDDSALNNDINALDQDLKSF